MFKHKGTAVIIGVSSSRSLIYARRLAAQGYDLILIAPQRKRLQAAAGRISDGTGASVEVLASDLRLDTDLRQTEQTLARDASITLLVNHALPGNACLCDAARQLGEALAPGFVARNTGAVIHITGKADCPLDDALWTEHLIDWDDSQTLH
jgi:NADP-dependent 3-hydroxy acid dehydrogenase YdfG